MPAGESPQCPVCRARFRRQRSCPRCGADLTALMRLAGQSWLAREAARAALRAGDLPAAARHARTAQQLQSTPAGRSILTFAAWMQHILGRLGSLRQA